MTCNSPFVVSFFQVSTFEEAVTIVGKLAGTPSNDEKLGLYKYYKQVKDVRFTIPNFISIASFPIPSFPTTYQLFDFKQSFPRIFFSLTYFSPIYSFFFHSFQGDVQGSQPWALQVEARAKWDAWNSVKGMSADDAKTAYIALANELITKYGTQ